MQIDAGLVGRLIAAQFTQWADLELRAVVPGGWDNRTFRLGEELVVRLPSAAAYAPQVEREHASLVRLAPRLPVPVPRPIGLGRPGEGYPWPWSIRTWIEGEPVSFGVLDDKTTFAADLADFLAALRQVDAAGGAAPGPDNFFRGGALETYDAEVCQAIDALKKEIDAAGFSALWDNGLAARWSGGPVWVHGDFSADNLLAQNGRLCGVIDFGQCCIGDPACDYTIAWTLFDPPARDAFRMKLQIDEKTWARARAWAIWKALIVAAGRPGTNQSQKAQAWLTLGAIAADRYS